MSEILIDAVVRAMDEVAAREVMPRWRNLGSADIAEKTGPEDIVTVADQASEQALTVHLEALLPGSTVVGEEAVSADPGVRDRFRGRGPVWVIDPIDGTSAFAAGETEFALMVALVDDGRPAAGWIVAPALGLAVWGGPAYGTHLRLAGAPVSPLSRPTAPANACDMIGLLGKRNITPERRAELKAKERHFKALDAVACAGIDYPRLARGEAHFAVYSKSEPWDHLPGLAILAALGFHYAKHDGSAYLPGDNTGGLLVAPDAQSLMTIRALLLA
ncbi:MAG: inositol monophosphatase family protein [Hyphomicrobiaceae bacterium]|nr:inositol monophosphatase family protein [Hyphomicrobiaceae bacterium]